MKARDWMLAGTLVLTTAYAQAAEGRGLSTPTLSADGISLPGRLSLRITTTSTGRFALTSTHYGKSSIGSVSLMGDYFLGHIPLPEDRHSGFRTTGGVFVSSPLGNPGEMPRRAAGNALPSLELRDLALLSTGTISSDANAVPYLGIGYTSFFLKNDLSVSADFGLTARKLRSAVQFGQVLNGKLSMEELLRSLRLSPVLQLGVSYSF